MDTEEFDSDFERAFDSGEDVTPYVDWSRARQPGREIRRVNVDFPASMVRSLDLEATRIGVTRQSLIKMWLSERLERDWLARHPKAIPVVAEDGTTMGLAG